MIRTAAARPGPRPPASRRAPWVRGAWGTSPEKTGDPAGLARPRAPCYLYKICKIKISGALNPADSWS